MPLKIRTEPRNPKELPNADDKAFDVARKHHAAAEKNLERTKVASRVTPDEPCCGNCKRWMPPSKPGDFGECTFLMVVSRYSGGHEKGEMFDHEQIQTMGLIECVPFRTLSIYEACRFYRSARDEVAA